MNETASDVPSGLSETADTAADHIYSPPSAMNGGACTDLELTRHSCLGSDEGYEGLVSGQEMQRRAPMNSSGGRPWVVPFTNSASIAGGLRCRLKAIGVLALLFGSHLSAVDA